MPVRSPISTTSAMAGNTPFGSIIYPKPEAGALYPQLILAEGRTPPEDVGGPPGYEHFLEAINDPSHDDHDEMREWYLGEGFDPRQVDEEVIQAGLMRYARQWKPKAKAK